MPAPFFFHRPSGYFCRFRVPNELRGQFGTRFVVRALFTHDQDHARLSAAILAISITQLCDQLRRGECVNMVTKLDEFRVSHWNAAKVTLPNGMVFDGVQILNDEDQARFNTMLGVKSAVVESPPTRLLSLCIKDFILEKKNGGMADKTLSEYDSILHVILLGTCEDRPLSNITTDMTNEVIRLLQGWPANVSKHQAFVGLPPAAILSTAVFLRMPPIQANTRDKYLDRLRSFFQWSIECSHWNQRNPFAKRRSASKAKRNMRTKQPFSDNDLVAIFDPDLRSQHLDSPHKFWCPLIALYSGARINEIAQLYVDDITTIGEQWVFRFDDTKPDQKLKNAASKRSVPIHSKLIELGLLDYLQDVRDGGFERVFPNLPYSKLNGYGDAVGDWFNARYLRPDASKPRAGISDPSKTFHSFRYVVINRLHGLTDTKTHIAEISGHDRGGDTLTNVYITPSEVDVRAVLLNQLSYPSLSFETYCSGQYGGYFRRLQRKFKMDVTPFFEQKNTASRITG